MANIIKPSIGQWYRSEEYSDPFEIVAMEEGDTIEMQFFDGELEELDIENWDELHLKEVAPPEDWSGAYEVNKEDIYDYLHDAHPPQEWDDPLDYLEINGY